MNESSPSSSWDPVGEAREPSVQDLFARYLYRREDGDEEEFERLLAQHPAQAAELRALRRNWEGVAGVLGRLGGPDGAEPAARNGDAEAADALLEAAADEVDAVLARLALRGDAFSRYARAKKLDEGGQGTILRVWDEDLERPLAMKVMRADRARARGRARSRSLLRFLDEAKVTGQLDHPGVVPIHELGLDPSGRVYFTMKLVEGEDLRAVFRKAWEEREGWSRTRVLGVLLRACEAVAYAHSKQVVHRDLKPSNVMVGRFGEVFVMDWGLARVMTREPEAEGPAPDGSESTQVLRLQALDETPLRTMEGDVVGTPAYMAPEQALGWLGSIGPATDVYALGAMLYELFAERMPYAEPGTKPSSHGILERVQSGPPQSLAEVAPDTPPELVAIAEKAMARDPVDRYATVEGLAEHLRAFLEGRVVDVYRTGPLVELQKWVRRNRGTAGLLAALLLVVLGAGFAVAAIERERSALAAHDLDESTAAALVAGVDDLYPVHPDRVPAMRAWLASARDVVSRRDRYEAELAALERRTADAERVPFERPLEGLEEFTALNLRNRRAAFTDLIPGKVFEKLEEAERRGDSQLVAELERELITLEAEVPRLDRRIAALEEELAGRRDWAFADAELEREYAAAFDVVADLRALDEHRIGAVEERLEQASGLRAGSIDDHREAWERAIASIADRDECPLYDGLVIAPQLGLVPLGRDPRSGLWEFLNVPSGEAPVRDEEGRFHVEPETGIVLVLIPGGSFHMGAQSDDPDAPNFAEPGAYFDHLQDSEGPVHAVELEPYFLSKYELTVAQWERLAGDSPNEYFPGFQAQLSPMIRATNPVEHVSWEECAEALARWGLRLPTEAQWERVARAGTQTAYWSGQDFASLAGTVNFADMRLGRTGFQLGQPVAVDDGYALHGGVDVFGPNPWGLHAVTGNVWEWCLDSVEAPYVTTHVRPGTGEHIVLRALEAPQDLNPSSKALRGGSFKSSPGELRVSRRYWRLPSARDDDLGVRPCRLLEADPAPLRPAVSESPDPYRSPR